MSAAIKGGDNTCGEREGCRMYPYARTLSRVGKCEA